MLQASLFCTPADQCKNFNGETYNMTGAALAVTYPELFFIAADQDSNEWLCTYVPDEETTLSGEFTTAAEGDITLNTNIFVGGHPIRKPGL